MKGVNIPLPWAIIATVNIEALQIGICLNFRSRKNVDILYNNTITTIKLSAVYENIHK